MSRVRRLPLPNVGDGTVLLVLTMLLGLVLGPVAEHTKPLLIPSLALAMTFSTISVRSSALLDIRGMVRPTLAGIVFGYLIQTTVIVLAAWWLEPAGDLWIGFVLVAITPPAISVITMTDLLRGNTTFSLIGVVGTYLASFVIMPIIALLLLGQSVLNPIDLLVILVELILVPLVCSRILIRTGIARRIDRQRPLIANLCLSIGAFTMIGLNRDVFISRFDTLIPILVVALINTFVLGHLIEFVLGRMRGDKKTFLSLTLFGTMKNTSMASTIGLSLFSPLTAVPAAVITVAGTIYFLWLKMWVHRADRGDEGAGEERELQPTCARRRQ